MMALADPTRRFLLDRVFEGDGRTLSELEHEVEMTRLAVMKHPRLVEDANLVITLKSGPKQLRFLNPVTIRLIHGWWINTYAKRHIGTGRSQVGTGQDATTTAIEPPNRHESTGLPLDRSAGDLEHPHPARWTSRCSYTGLVCQ